VSSILITGFYGSILALIFIFLTIRVIKLRRQLKVGIGDGDQPALAKAIRVHGNFAEYIPLALMLLAFAEINGISSYLVHGFGATLIISRILHAIGLTQTIGKSWGRFWGMISLFLVIIGLAVINIGLYIPMLLQDAGFSWH
jgi:hypothetical protein